jgi:hypothetical protein
MDSDEILDFEEAWCKHGHWLTIINTSPVMVEIRGVFKTEDLEIIAEFLRKSEG